MVELSAPERLLYERLLDCSPVRVDDLVADEPEPGCSDRLLTGLLARGLVVLLPGEPSRVEARHPRDAYADTLAAQRDQVRDTEALVAGLSERYARARRTPIPLDLIEVISDPDEILRQHHEMERLAVRSFRGCDRPPYVSDPDGGDETMYARLAAGVHYRVLSDPRSRGLRSTATTQAWAKAGVEFREMTDVPLKLMIADDVRALLVLDSNEGQLQSSLVVHPSALLEGLCAVFDSLWALATVRDPLSVLNATGEAPHLAPDNVDLLSLLATGMTEEGIARRLGLSSRTVQRRVSHLLRELGATNRFQAGLWAGRRGWL